ncbi:MAG: hypothetical protein P1V20_07500 [Verrucomicrobiales bacterium]|nr:hypothetical protein [Verrucomicrobiales bacterium]
MDLEYSDLSFVGLSKGIEALHVEVRNVPTRKEGAKKRQVAVDELFLPDMPNLKDLSISAPAAPDDFVDTMLRSTPEIRMIFFNCSSYYTFPAKWKNIDQLFSLESLHIKKGIRISAVELSRLEKLRSITFGDHAFDANDPGLPGWLNKPQMLAIHSSHHFLSDALWEKWAMSGGLASVIRLETFNNLDLPKLESVELLLMRRKKVALELFPDAYISKLGELNNLAYLSIEFPNQEALESLSRLPGRDHIETLKIVNGTWTDLAPLANLSQLKRIIIMNSKEVEKVDLTIFPRMKTFSAFNMSELREVEGIATHPELESVGFQSCKNLVDLGEAAPNQTLRSFAIHRCGKVEDVEVLNGTTGLQQLILDVCPQLKGPREILDHNPVGFSYIKSAGVFEDRNVHEP